jgi:hypothetical protein
VKLDKSFAPVAAILDPLTAMISKWVDTERDTPAFTVEQQDLFSCVLTTFDGYQYTLGPELLAVEFQHRLRLQPRSAGPPVAEMLSKPQPYTTLLPRIAERLVELVRLVTTGKHRQLQRVGVISTTVVSQDEAPPGISRFLKHVGKPWGTQLEFFNIGITTKLPKVKGTVNFDRCHHGVAKQEHGDGLTTIRLDWQRYLEAEKNLSMTSLPELLKGAQRDALAYFEDIGQGARFDD